jgi:hypothetical protein
MRHKGLNAHTLSVAWDGSPCDAVLRLAPCPPAGIGVVFSC